MCYELNTILHIGAANAQQRRSSDRVLSSLFAPLNCDLAILRFEVPLFKLPGVLLSLQELKVFLEVSPCGSHMFILLDFKNFSNIRARFDCLTFISH